MELTQENYRSEEANREYWSYSKLKAYMGCQARGHAMYSLGTWKDQDKTCYLAGHLTENLVLGTQEEQDQFMKDNEERLISSRGSSKGQLKSEFKKCVEMANTVKMDIQMMKYLQGDMQQILEFEWQGLKWKCMPDVLNLENEFITDFKTCKDFGKAWRYDIDRESNVQEDFYITYGYHIQAFLYRKAMSVIHGVDIDMYLACVSKQDYPDKELMIWDNDYLEDEVESEVVYQLRIIQDAIKEDDLQHCGKCDYCRSEKMIVEPRLIRG